MTSALKEPAWDAVKSTVGRMIARLWAWLVAPDENDEGCSGHVGKHCVFCCPCTDCRWAATRYAAGGW